MHRQTQQNLDLLYFNVKEAYSFTALQLLDRSDHNLAHLLPPVQQQPAATSQETLCSCILLHPYASRNRTLLWFTTDIKALLDAVLLNNRRPSKEGSMQALPPPASRFATTCRMLIFKSVEACALW